MSKKDPMPIADVVDRNIKVLLEVRRQMDRTTGVGSRIADRITAICGSVPFVFLHVVWFCGWILWNTGKLQLVPFDPYPFGLLTTIVSLEAIFLSMFVLMSQKRMAELGDQRSDLDLQIDLLAEYEITKVLRIVDAIADEMKIDIGKDPELEQLKTAISPERMLKEMAKLKNGF